MLHDDHPQRQQQSSNVNIAAFARETRDDYLNELNRIAKKKVTATFSRLHQQPSSFVQTNKKLPLEYPNGRRRTNNIYPIRDIVGNEHPLEHALNSLRKITLKGARNRIPIPMKTVDKPGSYHAWAPVKRNHMVHTLDEPYVHYFGDTDADVDRATSLYKAMREDYNSTSAERLLSDGEVDGSGFFHTGTGKHRRLVKDDIKSLRLREAQRHAVMETVYKHGKTEFVLGEIAKGIGVDNIRRIQAIYNVALARKKENENRKAKKRMSRDTARDIAIALKHPTNSLTPILTQPDARRLPSSFGDTIQCSATLFNFCTICCEFACGLHDNDIVIPLFPIEDSVKSRIEMVRSKRALPCTGRCHLLDRWEQDPIDPQEKQPWTDEEIGILKDALMMFREDPCEIALLVGTRCCREINDKIKKKKQSRWNKAAESFIESKRRRSEITKDLTLFERNLAKIRNPHGTATGDTNEGDQKIEKNYARKSSIDRKSPPPEESSAPVVQREYPRFLPCTHEGYCYNAPMCNCKQNEMHCDSRCACNNGRWREKGDKLVWTGGECGLRSPGCKCGFGKCNTESCQCIRDGIICNPSVCRCTSQILPSKLGVEERHCRNSDIIVPRHKKTYIGSSFVHGLGLFAGEVFYEGDIVGVYNGVLMDVSIIEKAIRVSQERNNTYAFDITEDRSIDAAILGTKIKFVNHCDSPEHGQNCKSSFMRMRGEALICLRATRRIEPGEEFLFDYKITHEQGNEWLQRSLPKSSKNER